MSGNADPANVSGRAHDSSVNLLIFNINRNILGLYLVPYNMSEQIRLSPLYSIINESRKQKVRDQNYKPNK